MRHDGRTFGELRPVKVRKDFVRYPEGSVLIECGNTKVLCSASIEEKVPPFLKGTGKGWVTAEYSMLPRATQTRTIRESSAGKVSGRTQEIQRLIGRSLRAAVSMEKLGERTVWIDCDVLQADGGTRTAAITGGYIALAVALERAVKLKMFRENPLSTQIAAVSIGIRGDDILVDLDYAEDSTCDIDLNLVMDADGRIVEIQGTGERGRFTKKQLDVVVARGWRAIRKLQGMQKRALR